jgi:hypothetical protein
MVDDSKCGGRFKAEIDISNVEVVNNDKSRLDIKFNDNLIFKMKYPTYSIMKLIDGKEDVIENKIKIISASIDRIFSKGQYYSSKDFTPEELRDFLENLTQQQFEKLDEFITDFPTFYATGNGKCPKCGKEHTVRYKDFVNFFR